MLYRETTLGDRIALIYGGRMIAMGSPVELKTRVMQDKIIDLRCPEPQTLIAPLKALAVLMGRFVFDVRIVGNTALLFALSSLFLTGALFFGLTLSIKLKSQVLANQLAIIARFLPTLLLSGFVFAIENMPLPLQFLTYIIPALMPSVMLSGFMFPITNMPESIRYATFFNPMRWYLEILRGIVMKDVGVAALWPAIAAQSGLTITFLMIAVGRFKKTVL